MSSTNSSQAYCELRGSPAVQNALAQMTHADAPTGKCSVGTFAVNNLCLSAQTDDDDANLYRCNLRCMDSTWKNDSITTQCAELGDDTCTFSALDCEAIFRTAGGSGDNREVADDACTQNPSDIASSNAIMADAFAKTQMMRELAVGVASRGRANGPYPDILALGLDAKVREFVHPPNMDVEDRQRFVTSIVEDLPMITSVHDRCCPGRTTIAGINAASTRTELDKIASVLGAIKVDEYYDPFTTCPGKDAPSTAVLCPDLDALGAFDTFETLENM